MLDRTERGKPDTDPAEQGDRPATARLAVGASAPVARFETIAGETVAVGDRPLTHIQFRRFAGCPVCNLHLRSFVRRKAEVAAAGIGEVVMFHSAAEALRPYAAALPLPLVADPGKRLYRAFGVESGRRALLDPRAWPTILRAVAVELGGIVARRHPVPPLNPSDGRLGLPADFLVDADGRIRACSYGSHADDQWSVDQLLALARQITAGGT